MTSTIPDAGSRRPVNPTRRSRLSAGERREHLLDVAAELVVELGIDALTMEAVAARAGVSRALGYAYFTNKDALVVELFEREMVERDRRILIATRGMSTFEERIRGITGAVLDLVGERGALLGVLLGAPSRGVPLEQRQRERQRVAQDFFVEMAVAEFSLDPPVAQAATTMLLASVQGLLAAWLEGQLPRDELTEVFVCLVVGGYGALAQGHAPFCDPDTPPVAV